MRDVEHLLDDYPRFYDAWEAGGVDGLVIGPLEFGTSKLLPGVKREANAKPQRDLEMKVGSVGIVAARAYLIAAKFLGERREDERATQIKAADRITYASVPILPTLPPRHQHLQAAHCIGQQP